MLESVLVDITDAKVVGRYVVELTFETGEVKIIDLEPHLWGEMFEPLLDDYALFLAVRADPDSGTIVWPNGADLSPGMLYLQSKARTPA